MVLSLALAMPLLFTSCRKYADGPTISFRSKEERIANNWAATFVFRNNIDETARYESFNFTFIKSGAFTWTVKPAGATEPVILTGTWELASVKEQIKLTYFDAASAEVRLLYMDILKLYEDEIWLGFISEGDQYDLKMFPL